MQGNSQLTDETEQNTDKAVLDDIGEIPNEPSWLRKMTPKLKSKHPQTGTILKPLSTMLAQLPFVAETHNKAAMDNYYQQVSRELLKLYYVRIRLISSSTVLTDEQKNSRISTLGKEYKKQLRDIAVALGDYKE